MLRIERRAITHPDAARLVEAVQGEYVRRYGEPDDSPLDAAAFDAGAGAFFVGYDAAGDAVATGGWRLRDDVRAFGTDRTAEVRRMYVAPPAQRRGFARAMLAHLESTAAAAGAEAIVLETGHPQPEAMALYASSGYVPIGNFGYYRCSEQSVCYGKPVPRSGV